MKVLITGAQGQLGTELRASAPAHVQIIATDVSALDITDRERVKTFVADSKPDLIINAAAYTAVDKAEAEPDLAFKINRDGAAHLAEAAHAHGARLIHISTDYVFDGTQSTPYKPADKPNPINVYGASKLAGEQAVLQGTEGGALIVRTAWVYSTTGTNFVKTMLRLLRERDEVRVVCDQIGTPTHAAGLARALWQFVGLPGVRGIYHWTDAGTASWYDFASAIRCSAQILLPAIRWGRVASIATVDYPTAARRPPYGVLDKRSTWRRIGRPQRWQCELEAMLTKTIHYNAALA